MSGQYPGGMGQNTLGGSGGAGVPGSGTTGPGSMMQMGARGQFSSQQQQMMNTMAHGMGQHNAMVSGSSATGGMPGQLIQMSGYPQGMTQQPTNQMQTAGVMGMGQGAVTNPMGMQSPSHVQQMMQQQQLQVQQQQMGSGSGSNIPQIGMVGAGNAGTTGMSTATVGLMQQQQQQQQQQMQQTGVVASAVPTSQAQLNHGNMLQQSQQPQTQGCTQAVQANMLGMTQPNPHKEINIVALSRLGQETVQDITSRFQEIFAALKIIQPTANRDNNTEKKVQEYFRTIRLLFKRVRIIYEKCNDGYPQGMEYTQVESLIPYKDEPEHRLEPTQCEEYRKALQENQELIETVKLKNRQLREIIERTRIIIWEINTMLSMRRS